MKFDHHLTTKVASSFLLLSLVAVGMVGGFAFVKAREALKQAAFNQLNVTATLKEEEITRWFEDQQRDFLLSTQSPDVQVNLRILLNREIVDTDYKAAYTLLSKYLIRVAELKPNLKEIFILNRSNQVILSTNKLREGQYEILANITYINQVETGESFAPIFYVSPVTGKPSVTLATPLRGPTGVRQGIILTELNLDRIDQIVRERTGLGKSGETYLVGSLITENTFISKEQINTRKFTTGISSPGIDAAMSGVSGSGLYRNYAGVPVLGVYRWLNDRDLALLVEIHQQEAFAPARQLAGTIVLVGLVSAGVLLTGVYWLSRQLKISHEQLENYSHRLEQKAQEAEAANRAKSEFLASMSHELRTPLNAILGFAQLMERDAALTPQQRNSLATINRSGEHLLNLINDVLEMSKIEARRIVLNPAPFALHRLLQTIQEMFQIRAEAKQLSLRVELATDLPQYICTDEGKLRQVLINLMGNAIKFTDAGEITVRVSAEQESINQSSWKQGKPIYSLQFEIEDTGKGIAAAELAMLFQPFVQTASGAKVREGTGLGLAISRQYVQLMGGDIRLTSVVDQGSIFQFDVKAELVESSEVALPSTRGRVLRLAPDQPMYRILVVDDRKENCDVLTQLLSTVGFETLAAFNGQEAIAHWQAWYPHLIWMDMRMPVMDGYEATRQIKAQPKGQATVIIALSASAFEEQRADILAAGCEDLVCKPFREQIIFDKMAEYLGVQYIYAEEQKSKRAEEQRIRGDFNLKSSDLAAMPIDWVAALHQAAIEVDAELIFQLIEQIPKTHLAIAERLAEMVHHFCFDEIIDLTQKDHAP